MISADNLYHILYILHFPNFYIESETGEDLLYPWLVVNFPIAREGSGELEFIGLSGIRPSSRFQRNKINISIKKNFLLLNGVKQTTHVVFYHLKMKGKGEKTLRLNRKCLISFYLEKYQEQSSTILCLSLPNSNLFQFAFFSVQN